MLSAPSLEVASLSIATINRSTREIGVDLDGVVTQIAVGLVGSAFGDPDGVVRRTTGHGGGFQRSSEAKGVVATLAVDLSTIGVNREVDGIVAGPKIDDVFLRTTVLNDVITTKGGNGIGACAAEESVGRRGAGNGVVTRCHERELSWWVSWSPHNRNPPRGGVRNAPMARGSVFIPHEIKQCHWAGHFDHRLPTGQSSMS